MKTTKILVTISLIIFFIAVTAVFGAGLVVYELKKQPGSVGGSQAGLLSDIIDAIIPGGTSSGSENSGNQNQTNTENNAATDQTSQVLLSADLVARHNQANDCWMIIDGKIYNFTSFLAEHPGGKNPMIPYCGKDGSSGFSTKGYNPGVTHTSFARDLLPTYYIGVLGETIAQIQPKNSANPQLTQTVSSFANLTTLPTPSPKNTTMTTTTQTTVPPPPPPAPPATSNLTLTTQEIASHNTTQNCWIIVSGQVYDVTSYLSQHPGGVQEIANTCGTDATNAFQTRGGKGSNHSNSAYNLLAGYRIGAVGASVPVDTPPSSGQTTSPPGTNTNPTPTTSSGGSQGGTSSGVPASVLARYPGATLKKIEDDGQEMEIITAGGQCRKIKINSSGTIIQDENC